MNALSVREAAVALHSTTKWVYDLLYAGRLPGAVKSGRIWRIPREAIRERTARAKGPRRGGRRGRALDRLESRRGRVRRAR